MHQFFYKNPEHNPDPQVRREECEFGLIIDGRFGIPRPLTEIEKVVHMIKGNLPVFMPPDDYVQPLPIPGESPTELI